MSYLPVEAGTYLIHIQWNGRNVPQSPFRAQISAGAPKALGKPKFIGDWSKLLDESTSTLKLLVGEETSLTFEVPSGPAKMVAELETPNGMRIPVSVERLSAKENSQRLRFYFTPIEAGETLHN